MFCCDPFPQVNECGDISQGIESTGGHFNPHLKSHGSPDDTEKHAGDLGNVHIGNDGKGKIRLEVHNSFHVSEIIGRSLVLDSQEDDLVCVFLKNLFPC